MNNDSSSVKSPRPTVYDTAQRIAEHRETIIKLEAHGLPSDDADALWDAMGNILADMKRHQSPSSDPASSAEI